MLVLIVGYRHLFTLGDEIGFKVGILGSLAIWSLVAEEFEGRLD